MKLVLSIAWEKLYPPLYRVDVKIARSLCVSQTEIKRLRAVMKDFDRIVEATIGVLERLTQELCHLKGTADA